MVKRDWLRKVDAVARQDTFLKYAPPNIPSMELPSLTENLRPSSLMVTCALFEKVMQRRRRNSWRAELETAVRTGGSSSSMFA